MTASSASRCAGTTVPGTSCPMTTSASRDDPTRGNRASDRPPVAMRRRSEAIGPLPWVGVIMGSKSDLEYLAPAVEILTELQIPHEVRTVSAHRTPVWMAEYATTAESRGLEVVIAAAG